jgi:hypothetical protein
MYEYSFKPKVELMLVTNLIGGTKGTTENQTKDVTGEPSQIEAADNANEAISNIELDGAMPGAG